MLPARAHPLFSAHFTDPIYDGSDEVLPFGTDEGSDTLADAVERKMALTEDPRLELLRVVGGYPPFSHVDCDREAVESVVSAAFSLVFVTGHISDSDRRSVLTLLDREIREGGVPLEFVILRNDLASFGDIDPTTEKPAETLEDNLPWLYIDGGVDIRSHQRWLNGIAKAIQSSADWQAWWSHSPIPLLTVSVLDSPIFDVTFSDDGYYFSVERSNAVDSPNTWIATGVSRELRDELEPHFAPWNSPYHTAPMPAPYTVTPRAPEMFRDLIHRTLMDVAQQLHMPEPPDHLGESGTAFPS